MADFIYVALAGGVGGAKMAHGLAQVLQPEQLAVVVNTADDFTHLGLRISPDLDTVCYTLAGEADASRGWGRKNETWNVFNRIKQLGMPDWFQLGDADLATHLFRTAGLEQGKPLSQVTRDLCRMMGVALQVLPMSDDLIQTHIFTSEGELGFQEYFVHRKCNPEVKAIKFVGIESSQPAPGVLEAIRAADAVIFCPSNPWVSIDPILSVPGIKKAIEGKFVLAVSPIIGSETVKGPAAKMFAEMGIPASALAVAEHYGNILTCLMIDKQDEVLKEKINTLGIQTYSSDILMRDEADRGRLAMEIIEYIEGWESAIQ